MIRRADSLTADLSPTARTTVRLPGPAAPSRIFQGWGPDLSGR